MKAKTNDRSARTAKATRGKSTRGGDGRAARGDGKAGRKTLADVRAGIDEMFMVSERKHLAEPVLPFGVHGGLDILPTWDSEDPPLREYDWSPAEVAIADTALMCGYRLTVPVRPDCIAWATCRIVRRLKSPVVVWYTRRHERLLLGVLEDDQNPVEEEADDGE